MAPFAGRLRVMAFRVWLPAFVLFVASFSQQPATAAGLPDTIAKIKPGIVAVGTFQESRHPQALFRGTGFVVGDGRTVVTNAHLLVKKLNVQRRETHAVFFRRSGKIRIYKARVLAKDAEHDIVILGFEGAALPALSLGDDRKLREGQQIAFTGFPIGSVLGLYPVTHRGIISALTPIAIPVLRSRELDPSLMRRLKDDVPVLQLDATAYPGNSGSPVYLPDTGEVVGILSSVFVKESKERVLSDPSGISYAIPIRRAKKLLKRIAAE